MVIGVLAAKVRDKTPLTCWLDRKAFVSGESKLYCGNKVRKEMDEV